MAIKAKLMCLHLNLKDPQVQMMKYKYMVTISTRIHVHFLQSVKFLESDISSLTSTHSKEITCVNLLSTSVLKV